jgi:8-oxo-dGTP diphosphatase
MSGEALEETGLVLDHASAKVFTANNNVMSDIERHYVTVFISANVLGDPTPKVYR